MLHHGGRHLVFEEAGSGHIWKRTIIILHYVQLHYVLVTLSSSRSVSIVNISEVVTCYSEHFCFVFSC